MMNAELVGENGEEMEVATGTVGPSEKIVIDCEAITRRNLAARRIQSIFRGWLIRSNLSILAKCAVKIQGIIYL